MHQSLENWSIKLIVSLHMKQAVFKNQLNNIPQKLPIHVYIYLNIFGESCFAE